MSRINEIDKLNWREWRESFKDATAIKPKEVNTLSVRTGFYREYLWRLFLGSVHMEVPEHWCIDYVRRCLFVGGAFCITKWQGVVIPAAFNVVERNVWKYPLQIQSRDEVDFGYRKPGTDAAIIYLNDSWSGTSYAQGISDTIDVFAEKLADADGAIDINLLNSRAAFIFQADSQPEAMTLKALFTKIMNGEPAVFWRKIKKGLPSDDNTLPITTLPIKQNYVADLIQQEKRAIVNEFLTMIGVNNNNAEKKERQLVDEINANNEEIDASVAIWQDNVDRCLKQAAKLYPEEVAKIKIDFASTRFNNLGGQDNEQSKRNTTRFDGVVENRPNESE